MIQRIILAGGSGFLGRALAQAFSRRGFAVTILTRAPHRRSDGICEVAWDGKNSGPWTACLENATAVVNLTGKNINCPHTSDNLRAITDSRVDSVNAIAAACQRLHTPPSVWVQASATGIYGDTGSTTCNETSPVGTNSLANICRQWEGSLQAAVLPFTRKVLLRIGFVLGRDGGALPVLSRLTRLFLGGAAGRGNQYISWIHLEDLVRMFVEAVADKALAGVLNAVAPAPVTNAEFMRELRQVLSRPWSPPAPILAVKLGARLMGSEPSLALVSQRSLPERFIASGFQFKFPELPAALQDLCR